MRTDASGNRNPQAIQENNVKWFVKLTIRRMGRDCGSCKQDFECEVDANGAIEAAAKAKELSGANPETHKFSINFVREKT